MSAPTYRTHLEIVSEDRPRPLVENAVLGMILFCLVEAMLFAGLISAFMIVKSGTVEWPPLGQPRLPVQDTLINTAALLVSGVTLLQTGRVFRRSRADARTPLAITIALGAFFVVFQGNEWLQLLREGLTLTSSQHGSFFYLIVGMHASHAIVALGTLAWAWWRLADLRLTPGSFGAVSLFWYFVVVLWPILYWRVYL